MRAVQQQMQRSVARIATKRGISTTAVAAASTQVMQSNFTSSHSSAPRRSRWLSMLAGSAVMIGAAYQWQKSPVAESAAAAAASATGLNPKEFVKLKLIKRTKYNSNTDLFTFALADPSAPLDLPVSSFVMTRFTGPDGKDVIRPYTPIEQDQTGVMTLLVKNYPQGVMSKHFHELKVGDELEIKGPMPKKIYKANEFSKIGMVAGGTGITPCLQVLDAIVANPADRTRVSLVFANTTPADILLKERLDAIAKSNSNITVTYVVDHPTANWTGPTGHVTPALLASTMPKPAPDSFVYVCGPPPFMAAVSGNKNMKDYSQGELSGALKELGFEKNQVFKF